jgi:hypothetical protein
MAEQIDQLNELKKHYKQNQKVRVEIVNKNDSNFYGMRIVKEGE